MKRFGLVLLAIVLLLAGGLYALTFLDINAYRSEIASLAEQQTGRKLELAGPLEVGYSLTPTIVARDVRFGNASWGADPTMFTADRVAIRLSLFGLFAGSLDVAQLDVRGATVLLETGPQGKGNWVLDGAASETASAESEAQPSTAVLPRVVLDDVSITYRSGRRGEATQVELTRADIEPKGNGVAVGVFGDIDSNPASASALIVGDENAFRISDLKLSYDAIELTGSLKGSRNSSSAPVTIDGELSAVGIDLGAVVGGDSVESDQESLFSKAQLPFGALSVVNGEVDVTVDTLVYRDLEFTDFQTAITLKDGSLTAPIFATYGERRVEATFSAANSSSPRASLSLSAPGFDIGTFLQEVGATDLVEVNGHIGLDLVSTGKSPAELASNLNGKVDIATGRGNIHSSAFEWIAKDLIWALIPKGGETGVADLTCFIGEVDFKDGIGTIAALALVTSEMRTSGSGKINLRDETIEMRLNPRPNDPGLLSLATPVNVSGPLVSPSVLPDTGALLGDIAVAVGAGALTGGIGALLPLVSTEHFDADEASACLEVIGSRDATNSRDSTEGNILRDAGEGAGSLIEGVGDVLTSPFK
ncbi:MAG: AsmA family protein [Rhodobiaceae bacterium]|nr:AsmA family protein [Rhodobiaceae bacterium]